MALNFLLEKSEIVEEQKATNVRAHKTFSLLLSKLIRFKGTQKLFDSTEKKVMKVRRFKLFYSFFSRFVSFI